ncbi:MAG: dihydroneopterin aldolase [Bacteroidales bacterium]
MKSWIELEEMEFYAFHGVFEQESLVGNKFFVNLKLQTNIAEAMLTDEVTDTVSYADAFLIVQQEMGIRAKLLEHLTGRIVARLFETFPTIDGVYITLSKINPPGCGDIHRASVIIEATREEWKYSL